jgi:alpha-beta hydrolase superfamily lysophospholipase
MHIKGLVFVKRASREVARVLRDISCPVLTVHSVRDPIGGLGGVNRLQKRIKSLHKVVLFDSKSHNIFFSDKREEVYKEIGKFVSPGVLNKA